MSIQRLVEDLRDLSTVYPLVMDDNYESIIVKNFNLPPGYNYYQIPIWLKLSKYYPEDPPGVGKSSVYVPDDLRYKGKQPSDFHKSCGPKGWAWWCYEEIDWNPRKDTLITFFELLRAHMTNPE